ncbi:hypothetical protein FRC02_002526 [Tulasnella sp. 418]|nr:hypothetical protein FRC02_002526 [Tulasnella sp. 418]
MKLASAIAPVADLWAAITSALPSTIYSVITNPWLLFQPRELSRTFFSRLWVRFAPLVDEGGREVKKSLITPNARGRILDIGAGHGHSVFYLDRNQVTTYIALEPNYGMHAEIRRNAEKAGYSEAKGELLILGCGAEDVSIIISALGGKEECVDTIISILTLCSVVAPRTTIEGLSHRVLKEGGVFLYYEHVLSQLPDVQWWQRVWTPVWKLFFDGCRLDRPTHTWIQSVGIWDEANSRVWGKPGEPEEHLNWHRVGLYTKAYKK